MTAKRKANPVERIERALRDRFPAAEIELDPASTPTGGWFLDVRLAGHHVVIEWRRGRGFGVTSSPEIAYGEGVDEVIASERAALTRVAELLETRGRTSPARGLGELRKARGILQTELGERLGIGQVAVSRMESRDNLLVSTLRNVVEAMGGRLEVRAVFPDGEAREIELGGPKFEKPDSSTAFNQTPRIDGSRS